MHVIRFLLLPSLRVAHTNTLPIATLTLHKHIEKQDGYPMKFPRLLTSLLQFLRIPAEKPAVKPDVNSLNIRNSFDHYEQEKQWDLYMPLSRNSLSIEPDIPQRPFIIATFDAQAYGIQRKTQYYGGLLRSSTAHVYCFQRISIVEFQWLSNNEEVGKKWVVLPVSFIFFAYTLILISLTLDLLLRRSTISRPDHLDSTECCSPHNLELLHIWGPQAVHILYQDHNQYKVNPHLQCPRIEARSKVLLSHFIGLCTDRKISSRDSLRRMAALSRLYSQHGNDLVFFAGNAELPQEVVEPWDDVQAGIVLHSIWNSRTIHWSSD